MELSRGNEIFFHRQARESCPELGFETGDVRRRTQFIFIRRTLAPPAISACEQANIARSLQINLDFAWCCSAPKKERAHKCAPSLFWSRRRESNPQIQLGKLMFYH